MKCNVKGHRMSRRNQKELERMIFGAVFPTFQTKTREGKYRETNETKEKLEERKKLMDLIHANFEGKDLVQAQGQLEGNRKGE